MSNEWNGIRAVGTILLGTAATLGVMRLKLLRCSLRRGDSPNGVPEVIGTNLSEAGWAVSRNSGDSAAVKTDRLWSSILAGILLVLVVAPEARSQFRARLGNPSIPVQTEHPPELPLVAEKVVFGPATGECSTEIVQALTSHFSDEGLEVIDWQKLEGILGEHDLSFGGDVDPENTAQMGKILGPSTLLMIEVSRCGTDWQRFESSVTRKDSKTDTNYKVTLYHAKTQVLLAMSVQTVDLTTGRIFDARPITHSPELENQSEEGYPENPSEFAVQDIAFARVVSDVSRMLLPRIEERSLVFFDNKKCNLKAAHQALKGGDRERALALSLENLETCKNNPDPKMKEKKRQKILANAHYNAGLMHRIQGDLDAALEYLQEAEKLRPVEIMAEAISDCREAIGARDVMQSIREEAKHAVLNLRRSTTAEAQARRKNILTNTGVVALVKTGLSEAIILRKIETSRCEFDLSSEALVSLSEAGVGEKVIIAMMDRMELQQAEPSQQSDSELNRMESKPSEQPEQTAQSESDPALGVARISLARGEVAVQRGESGDSIQARANVPLVEGDILSTGPASRAEIQLDYSNLMRLNEYSSVRLASLDNRSFLVQVERGTVTYSELRGGDADVDIETPRVAVRPQKHGRYRIEVASEVDEVVVTVRKGRAEVASAEGRETLNKGQRMIVRGAGSGIEFQVAGAVPKDDWDNWNERRDRQLERSTVYQHVNRSIYGAEDLDAYGRWVQVPRYGRCWFPTVAAGWAPYRNGRWVWLDYYGWSWVSYDTWGWAPYHYGRWFRDARYGWGWHPGSYASHHRWRPALVAFFGYNGPQVGLGARFGHFGWIPLAPGEPYYPWFGGRYRGSRYGSGRRGSRNTILVDNSINIYNDYRNARHRNGVTVVDARDFSRGRMLNARSLQTSELRQARVMRGRIPVVPDRSSQGKLMHGTGRSVRGGSSQARFYSAGRARRSVTRNSFSRQQQEMADIVRSAGRTDSRAGRGANVRSSVKGNMPRSAATSRKQSRPTTRLGIKPSSRRSSRSPADSAARPGRKPAGRSAAGRPRVRSSGSGESALGSKRPSRVSSPGSTRPRSSSSRKVQRSRSPATKSTPRVDTRRSRSPSSTPSVSVPRSSSRGSSATTTSRSRRSPTRTGKSAATRSRRSSSSKSSTPSSAGSSGRSSPGKSSTRSRKNSKSDDRGAKDRKSGKR